MSKFRTMPRIYLFSVVFIAAAVVCWFVFVQIYKPDEQAYLETTTSYYFKHMSEAGLSGIAEYDDCRLQQGDQRDKQQGASMFGLCQTASATTDYFYMIAMSPTASFLYSDLEEIQK